MASFGPTELFVLNFVGIQEELGKLFGAHGSVLEYWVSQKKTGGATSNSGLYGVVRCARMRLASMPSRLRVALRVQACPAALPARPSCAQTKQAATPHLLGQEALPLMLGAAAGWPPTRRH
jgi:hypothetical protein